MLDDFFIRAIIAAIGIAFMAGPLGCFVVWQRLAYFGDTMAHSALLGVAFSLLFDLNMTLCVFAIALSIAIALYLLQKRENLSSDSILGILAHSTLAVGLVLLGFLSWVRVDLMAYLFGDILAASRYDIVCIWGGCLAVWMLLALLWRPLLALTVSEDIAKAEHLHPHYARFAFMIILALTIAIAMKLVGVLLITALLIIPASIARPFSKSPEQMLFLAALIGAVGCVGGLLGSYHFDTRSGASIVVALFIGFFVSRIIKGCYER